MEEYDIKRFLVNQFDIDKCLDEIGKTTKPFKWMPYVFPQVSGLAKSKFNKDFELNGISEAKEYYNIDILKNNLLKATNVILNHKGEDITDLLGIVNSFRLLSCMTLFNKIMPDDVFKDVIDSFYDGKECNLTNKILKDNEQT